MFLSPTNGLRRPLGPWVGEISGTLLGFVLEVFGSAEGGIRGSLEETDTTFAGDDIPFALTLVFRKTGAGETEGAAACRLGKVCDGLRGSCCKE